jgi:hypothetical protein
MTWWLTMLECPQVADDHGSGPSGGRDEVAGAGPAALTDRAGQRSCGRGKARLQLPVDRFVRLRDHDAASGLVEPGVGEPRKAHLPAHAHVGAGPPGRPRTEATCCTGGPYRISGSGGWA